MTCSCFRFASFLVAAVFGLAARAATPTAESVQSLLRLTDIPKLVDGFQYQVKGVMKASVDQAVKDKKLNSAEQAKLDVTLQKMTSAFESEMSLQKVFEIFVPIYQSSLTQEEVNSLISFYQGPGGNALKTKIPTIMQQGTAALQQLLVSVMANMKSSITAAVGEVEKSRLMPSPAK